ncbi:MAG: ABC transporter permease [Trueperaceae bacterium]|nr:ABC transporter permease [Trueperaceae bacterium]
MTWTRVPGVASLVWLALAVVLFALQAVTVPVTDPELRGAVGETASFTPDLWLPLFAFDGGTVIDMQATNDVRALTFGLLDAETRAVDAVRGAPVTVALGWFAALMALLEAGLAWAFRDREEKLVRPLVRAAGIFLVIWSFYGHEPFWDWMLRGLFPTSPDLLYNSNVLISLASQHLELVLVSSLLTITIGLSLGIAVTRAAFREFLPLVSDVVNSGQTVPTLAIIAIMAPIIGFGFWPAIVALILYGLLPIVRNTIVGLEGVDPAMIDAAKGMGMTPTQILWQIEVPSAASIILAGVRTSVVINVGTAALGAFVGSGGLGNPIASGLNQSIDPWVLLGALAAALLAILLDYILGRIEYVMTPKGLQIEQ